MSKVIVFKKTDGGCGIITPSPKNFKEVENAETGDVDLVPLTLEEHANLSVPQGLEWRICDVSDLPSKRIYRNAWTDNNPTSTVDVEMSRAREIQMGLIRVKRDEKLAELDIEQLKGVDVTAQKEVLRNIPQTFDLTVAQTPDELEVLWPNEVK